jgi:hypothetical protein
MKLRDQYGQFKVWETSRVKTGGHTNLRTGWIEYQVRDGRKVISRHERLLDAEREACRRHEANWDEIAAELKKWQ